jgi:putative heme transporter
MAQASPDDGEPLGAGGGPRTPRWRRLAGSAFSLAVVVAVFGFVLPSVADYGEVLDTIAAMTWMEVVALALVALLNLATYQPALMAALPGLRFTQALQVSQASTAVSNTVPAGAAFGLGLSATMYRSWGFGRRPITLALLLAGIWNIFAKLSLPVVGVLLLTTSGASNRALVAASAVGVAALLGALAVFAAVLRGERGAFAVGEWGSDRLNWLRERFGRAPISGFGHTLVKFRRETIDVVRTRWLALTVTTLVSQVTLVVVLLMALRNVGVAQDEVSWQQVFATFAFVRLLSALPITPGGVGVVELGLTAGLVAAGGPRTDVVAAVLVYRALTYLPPIPIGAVCYLHWRRRSA